jgi:hypothetical protein
MSDLDEMIGEGLDTLETVEIVAYRSSKKPVPGS